MKTISLNGTWKLSGKREQFDEPKINLEGAVPGCVQLDLSRQGFLPEDLFMGENILKAEEYEGWEWWYETEFDAPEEKKNVYLVFEGVDCIAEYYLNDRLLGESDNMLIAHEFCVDNFLLEGKNRLTVHIKSPAVWLNDQDFCMNDVKASWLTYKSSTKMRRPPHSIGWDIMPRAVTSGIWRDVKLEVRDEIRFSQFYYSWPVYWSNEQATFVYQIECPHHKLKDLSVKVRGTCGEDSFFEFSNNNIMDKVPVNCAVIHNLKLWWPYGYGEPNLYDVVAEIYDGERLVHTANYTIGFRKVELQRTDYTDGVNGCFRFLINGTEIMCKGSNWVPLDAFHCRDKERYAKALDMVRDIGCNILRCWGGNVYEADEFFDFCDRNGIMVWQDFAMACRWYPQDDAFAKVMENEVKSVVRRLRNHPSIILWAGDNENDIMAANDRNPEENRLTRSVIPAVVAANDGTRPYLASSPYMSPAVYKDRSLIMPEDHIWGPRDYFKSDYYRNQKAHFISETGYHGCPAPESIRKFIEPEYVWPYNNHNPQWILHSSDQMGNEARTLLMANQIKVLFGDIPDNLEDFAAASQISQAEAKKYFIERMRTGRPHKTGIIWWNLLDGWPQMSDAVVDYYFTRKKAYDYIKRTQAPFAVLAADTESGVDIFACNDTLKVNRGKLKVLDAETDEVLLTADFEAGENATTKIASLAVNKNKPSMLIFKWESENGNGFCHHLCFAPPISLEWYRALMKKHNL